MKDLCNISNYVSFNDESLSFMRLLICLSSLNTFGKFSYALVVFFKKFIDRIAGLNERNASQKTQPAFRIP